jgi:hypothetical protein
MTATPSNAARAIQGPEAMREKNAAEQDSLNNMTVEEDDKDLGNVHKAFRYLFGKELTVKMGL